METYANSRRMEKSLRLQNADLLTEYNPLECDLARPKVKAADFHGKEGHLKFRERDHQPATLCTLVMTSNIDSTGVARKSPPARRADIAKPPSPQSAGTGLLPVSICCAAAATEESVPPATCTVGNANLMPLASNAVLIAA